MLSSKVVIVLIACLPWSYCYTDSDYCSLCNNHTMCTYTDQTQKCTEPGDSGVSEKEKDEIVAIHNSFRRLVASGKEERGVSPQPKASNLMKFVWDEDLAKVAQRWVNQCVFEHDTCRNDPRWPVGQNIQWTSSYPTNTVNWTETISSWYSEVADFNPKHIQKYSLDAGGGHYSQLLWAKTYAIGCGRKDEGNGIYYACNYGPAGNVIGESQYVIGEPCSNCPAGAVCEDSLCALEPQSFRYEALRDETPNWNKQMNSEESMSTIPLSSTIKSQNDPVNSFNQGKIEDARSGVFLKVQNKGRNFSLQNSLFISGQGKPVKISWIEDKTLQLDEETKQEINKMLLQISQVIKAFFKKQKNKEKVY